MRTIYLTKGGETVVDDQDYPYLSKFNWYLSSHGYAVRKPRGTKEVKMHRVINNTPKDKHTDHINRNKLDNRRCNLRTVTQQENLLNRDVNKNNSSGFRGISFDKKRKRWEVRLGTVKGRRFLGYFENITDAINAVKQIAI